MSDKKYRLVTRSDFDGLVCAVLLNELDMIDDIKFVHPKDMQDGKVEITERDITTNLPYRARACTSGLRPPLSETLRSPGERPNHIIYPDAPSAARVVYEHYGGKEPLSQHRSTTMMLGGRQGRLGAVQRARKSSTPRTGCCSTT
jgi:hypothetical protein